MIRSALFCLLIVAVSIFCQYVFDLPSCSQCILQRWLFIGISAGFFAISFLRSWGRVLALFVTSSLSFVGLVVALVQLTSWCFPLVVLKAFSPMLSVLAFSGLLAFTISISIRLYGLKQYILACVWVVAGELLVLKACGCFVAPALSESLPQRAFFVTGSKSLDRGSFVSLRTKVFGKERNLIKIVGGLPGDQIFIDGDQVFVNGDLIGPLHAKTRCDRPVTPIGAGMIPHGKIFVFTPHPRSLDSRYQEIGLIPYTEITGKAYAIF